MLTLDMLEQRETVMFNEGDQVAVKDSGAVGVVLETYGDTVCVELSNGVEMEYHANQLMTKEEFNAQEDQRFSEILATRPKPPHLSLGPYRPQKGDRRRARDVIARLRGFWPAILVLADERHDDFYSLDDFKKVGFISELTGTPMVVWMGSLDLGGELMFRQVLAKTVLNNIVNETGLMGDALLATCRQALKDCEAK